MISLLLLLLASVAVLGWQLRRERMPKDFVQQVLLTVYVPFLLPIFCLCYATAGIATEREERTLVYLLTTPLPRWLIFSAKVAAACVLSVVWTMGSLVWLAWLARGPGLRALPHVWPGLLWATVAYVALFQLFSVLFRRATIVALGYSLFLETLVGNMPGIVKRLAVSFHARCLIFDATTSLGVDASGPFAPGLFQPLAADTSRLVLGCAIAILLACGLVAFTTREY